MNAKLNRILSLDRDDMSETERELFLNDLKKVTEEYFEYSLPPSLEITRSDDGFLICVLLAAHRIKNVKKPQ